MLLCASLIAPLPAEAKPRLVVTCASCLVVDEAGKALWARRSGAQAPIASATKMVTALVTIDGATLEQKVRVSPGAAATPGGKLSLIAGEVLTVHELLAALLLNSSNDAAVVLAEHVAGSEASFVERMNETVRTLGAHATDFINPHGLDSPGHVSSAEDLALIGAALLRSEVLAELVATEELTIESSVRTARLENTNLLLGDYVGAIGIKTGFTAGAGNVLVAAAEREGRRLIAVAMHSDDAFADAAALLDIGFARLSRAVLVDAGMAITEMVSGSGAVVQIQSGARWRGSQLPETISTVFAANPHLSLPVEAGATVGEIRIVESGRAVGSVPAVASASVRASEQGWLERGLLSLLGLAGRVQSAWEAA